MAAPWMPMHSPDEPFEGPMVNEIGTNVPSPLMPMIAPDRPFEGPMVNELCGGGFLWHGAFVTAAPGEQMWIDSNGDLCRWGGGIMSRTIYCEVHIGSGGTRAEPRPARPDRQVLRRLCRYMHVGA